MTETVITTDCGRLAGGTGDDGVSRFLGVPYAQPPTGRLRLRAPEPASPWQGVRDARRFGPIPPQRLPEPARPGLPSLPMDDDCLTLNLWTPDVSGHAPVMVFHHGGGFEGGAGAHYDAALLAREQQVVVVTMNYRVGALGFGLFGPALHEESLEAGNVGLLDQLEALRWVRRNASAFGGDPDNLTAFGHSAGAFSLGAMITMPEGDGLADKVILQSGSTTRAIDRDTAAAMGEGLLRELGVRRLAQLQEIPAAAIVEAQSRVCDSEIGRRNLPGGHTYGIVVDGRTVCDAPHDVAARDGVRGVATLVGATVDEVGLWASSDPAFAPADDQALRTEVERAVADPATAEELLDDYRRLEPDASPARLRSMFLTDWIYRAPAQQLAEVLARHQQPVWHYTWAWPGGEEAPRPQGVGHGAEVPLLFGLPGLGLPGLEPDAREGADEAGRTLRDRWGRFARDGDPGWPATTVARPCSLRFETAPTLLRGYGDDVPQAWATVARR